MVIIIVGMCRLTSHVISARGYVLYISYPAANACDLQFKFEQSIISILIYDRNINQKGDCALSRCNG